MRVFFSEIMGPLGISKAFLFHRQWEMLRRRGVVFSEIETKLLTRSCQRYLKDFSAVAVAELPDNLADIRNLLQRKSISHL